MSDTTADSGLIDVSGLGLSEVVDAVDESSLASALRRILARGEDGVGQYEFQSAI